MNLDKQVTSLDLSRRLKELGVKQESYFYWLEVVDDFNVSPKLVTYKPKNRIGEYKTTKEGKWEEKGYSAYTVAELGEIIKPHIKKIEVKAVDENIFDPDYWAKMLIYLVENNLINL